MFLLGLFNVASVLLLSDVSAIDNDDLAALFDLEAEVFKVFLGVEMLQYAVELKNYALLAGQLSRHC